MRRFRTGIAVAFTNGDMTRIPALLLTALIALAPVMGALCAGRCGQPEQEHTAQVAGRCEHSDVLDGSAALTSASCSPARADLVLAEIRTTGPAPMLPIVITESVAADRFAVCVRCLDRQPPLTTSRAVLRI